MFFIYTHLKEHLFDYHSTVDSLDKATGNIKSVKAEYYSHQETNKSDQPYPARMWATFNPQGKVIHTKSEHDTGWYKGSTMQRGFEVEFIYGPDTRVWQKNISFFEINDKTEFKPGVYNTDKQTYRYDENGSISNINYGDIYTEIIYDGRGRIAETSKYDRKGKYEYTQYEYDELDRVIKREEYGHFWDDESSEPKEDEIKLREKTLFEYDRFDDKLNRCVKKKSDLQYGYTTTKTYLFDDRLRIKKISEENSKGLHVRDVLFDYIFDRHDNMTELSVISTIFGENKNVVRYSNYKRTIEYW